MKLLTQLHKGNQMEKWQWKGDLQIAKLWNIEFPIHYSKPPQIIRWIKPWFNETKLNVDGSSKYGQDATGSGVARDHTGELPFGFSEHFGPHNSLKAELLAIERGFSLCSAHNLPTIWIEMDAKVIVNMIKDSSTGSHDIWYVLVSVCKYLHRVFYRISHLHREGNQATDFLSNRGYLHEGRRVFNQAEGQLEGMLKLDRINLPYVRSKYM